MKKTIILILSLVFLASGITRSQVLPVPATEQKEAIMLTGATIHTGTGEVIENGVIAFDNGKITAVGEEGKTAINRNSHRIIDVSGKHVYPGLILTNSNLGLSEIGSVEETQDSREFGEVNPGARSIVAYNTDSHVIPVVRSNGVLLAQVAPSGGLLSGTSSVVQLDAWNWEDAAYKTDQGIHLNWPRMSTVRRRSRYAAFMRPSTGNNYDENYKKLDKLFSDASAYAAIENVKKTNLKLEALKGLFTGEKTLFITISDSKSVMVSCEFAKNHGVKKVVLVNAGESAWMVKDYIKGNKIPVILGSIHSMPDYEHSDTRLPFKLAKMFNDEGILVGITYPGASTAYNLPFVAGQAVAYGLSKEDALKMITLNNAEILGVDDRTGSLEKGKDANIIVSTGDVLDMLTNNIEMAFITGREIDLDNKFKMLYRRFQQKYERNN